MTAYPKVNPNYMAYAVAMACQALGAEVRRQALIAELEREMASRKAAAA